MSASKDKKIFEKDDNTDSGLISGPLSEDLFSSTELKSDDDVDKPKDSGVLKSETKYEPSELDSGLDLSERLSSVKLVDVSTPTVLPPVPTITLQEAIQDLPPIEFLFRQDDDGDTQLHISAIHGCEKSVSTLIKVCPDRTWLDIRNFYGHTALHLAVLCGNAVVTRMLIMAGASVGIRDLNGQTPLHIATAEHQLPCLQALLAPLPDNVPRRMASILNQKDYQGRTCVHIAASAGHIDSLQTLVYYGADINAREGLSGWTPLHIAARRCDERMAQYLVDRCAGVALDARDYANRTPRRLLPHSVRSSKNAQTVLTKLPADSDSESDSEDEYDSDYDSDSEILFQEIREKMTTINVA